MVSAGRSFEAIIGVTLGTKTDFGNDWHLWSKATGGDEGSRFSLHQKVSLGIVSDREVEPLVERP